MNESIGRRTARNSIYSLAANVWNLLSRFLLTPLTLYFISIDEYGLWSLCFVVMSFMAMTTTGIEVAYVKYTAEYHAKGRQEDINRMLSTGIFIAGSIMTLLLIGLWFGMDQIMTWLQIDAPLQPAARWMIFGTGLVFTLDITLNSFSRVVDGLQRIDLTAKIKFITSFLEIVLIIAFFFAGFGVFGLLAAFMIRYLVAILISTRLAYKLLPGLKIRLAYVDRDSCRQLLNYGGRLQIIGFIGIFLSTFDRVIITRMLGLAATGIYEVGRKLPQTGVQIPNVISSAMMPAFSHLHGQQDADKARQMFLTSSRYMAMASSFVYSSMFAFAPYIIQLWLGPGYEAAAPIMCAISIGIYAKLLTGSSSAATKGMDRLDIEMRHAFITLLLLIMLVPLLAYSHGLLGAAVGVSVSRLIATCYFVPAGNRLFSVGFSEYFRTTLKPTLPFFVSAAVLLLLLPEVIDLTSISRWMLALKLIPAGIIHVLISVALLYLSQSLDAEERQAIKQRLPKFRSRAPVSGQ